MDGANTTATETTTVETQEKSPTTATPPQGTPKEPQPYYGELPSDHPLVKAFNATKDELKGLKEFKQQQEQVASQAEEERLKREQQYEALLPKKVDEATAPLKAQLEKLNTDYLKLQEKLKAEQTKYAELETGIKTEKIRGSALTAYIENGGVKEGAKEAFELIWAANKDNFVLDGDAVKVGDQPLGDFYKTLKTTPGYANLFTIDAPEGSGTPTTQGKTATTNNSGKAFDQAQFLKRGAYDLKDVKAGKIGWTGQ